MQWETIGLITLFHPEKFLKCDSSELCNFHHTIRYRAKRLAIAKSSGLPSSPKYLEDHLIQANGHEYSGVKDFWVNGSTITPHLSEPRLIRIPDEPPGRPKWRVEFRRQWPSEDPALHPIDVSNLITNLSDSPLRIRGIWINPSVDPTWPNKHWVNLVLGPCSEEHKQKHSQFDLHLKEDPALGLQISLNS